MHSQSMKTFSKHNAGRMGTLLLLCAMITGALLLFPAQAQAATTTWGPGHLFGRGGRVLPGFWVTGEVTTIEDESVTLELPNHRRARGMMRHISLHVTLAVDSSTILLGEGLEPLALTSLQEGDEVVVSPRLVWGKLTAQLLFAGDPEELANASYRGELVSAEGDTLTLNMKREREFTVLVDAETVWYENGPMERPAELPDGIVLRVLGVEDEDSEGNELIRAILITPAR